MALEHSHRPKPYDKRQAADDFGCKPVSYGYIQDVEDCLIVIAAIRRGMLRGTRTRFKGDSESFFQSGQIFAYRRSENSVVRWTDGLDWTPSRVAGKQFVYRRWQSNDPGPFYDPIEHYYSSLPHDEINLRRQMEYRKKVRNLTSSLVDGSKLNHRWITPGGLCKRTYTTKAADDHWHVYSYYTPQHALSGGLLRPTEDPQYASIRADFANGHESVRDLIQILHESEIRLPGSAGASDSEGESMSPQSSSRLSLQIPELSDPLRYVTTATSCSPYDASPLTTPISPGGVAPSTDFDRYRQPAPHGSTTPYPLGSYHDYYCSPSVTAVTEGFNRSPSLPTSDRHTSTNPSPSSFSVTLPSTRLSLPTNLRPQPNHLTLPPATSLAQYAIHSRAHRSDSIATSTTSSSAPSLVSSFSDYNGSAFGDFATSTPASAPSTKTVFSPFDLSNSLSTAPQRSYSNDNNYHSSNLYTTASQPLTNEGGHQAPPSNMLLRTTRGLVHTSPNRLTHDLNSPTNSDFEEMTKGMTVQRLNSDSSVSPPSPSTHTPPRASPSHSMYYEPRPTGVREPIPSPPQPYMGFVKGNTAGGLYESEAAY